MEARLLSNACQRLCCSSPDRASPPRRDKPGGFSDRDLLPKTTMLRANCKASELLHVPFEQMS
jgi:hypothetical protein